MRFHVLQHVPFEGLGSIGSWIDARGDLVTVTRLFGAESLSALADFDVLIVLGGPMSVNDEVDYPWLQGEKVLVKAAIEAGKGVLGICLGAQLIAASLGARVYPGRQKEIGWFPVTSCGPAAGAFRFPERLTVFHWHGETFDLPSGARHLARSVGCEHQAYQVGTRTLALQFHLETTAESARSMVANCRDELVPGPFIQTESQLLSAPGARYTDINALMERVLAYLTRATD